MDGPKKTPPQGNANLNTDANEHNNKPEKSKHKSGKSKGLKVEISNPYNMSKLSPDAKSATQQLRNLEGTRSVKTADNSAQDGDSIISNTEDGKVLHEDSSAATRKLNPEAKVDDKEMDKSIDQLKSTTKRTKDGLKKNGKLWILSQHLKRWFGSLLHNNKAESVNSNKFKQIPNNVINAFQATDVYHLLHQYNESLDKVHKLEGQETSNVKTNLNSRKQELVKSSQLIFDEMKKLEKLEKAEFIVAFKNISDENERSILINKLKSRFLLNPLKVKFDSHDVEKDVEKSVKILIELTRTKNKPGQ